MTAQEGKSMKKSRSIIEIDEAKCNGCGQCIMACAEGALALVDGKAKLISDVYCDGLGACIGDCPEGALKIVERVADDFDDDSVKQTQAVHTHPTALTPETLPCGCASSTMMSIQKISAGKNASSPDITSELGHWPVKLQLLGPQSPFLKDTDLLLLADCAAVAHPNLHRDIIKDKAVAIGCPKLDNLEAHIERLAAILKNAHPRTLTVVHMEVPCCAAFMHAAQAAIDHAGIDIPLNRIVVGRTGTIVHQD